MGTESASLETKVRLQQCAVCEFMEKGFLKASLRSICREAGVTMVAPDKKTLKKSVKSMFFMVQTRCEVETIKY